MKKTLPLLVIVIFLTGCMANSMRVPPETYKSTAKSDYPIRLTLTTGSIEYGSSNMLIPAGGIYVPVSGSGQPNWAYGRKDQESFLKDLKDVLDRNNIFRNVYIDLENNNTCCDSELNLNFVSTKQEGEVAIYYMDVVVTHSTPNSKNNNQHTFESNKLSEVIHIFDSYLKAARHKANDKLMHMVLADLDHWLKK